VGSSKTDLEKLQLLNRQNNETIIDLRKQLENAREEGFRAALLEIKKLVDNP